MNNKIQNSTKLFNEWTLVLFKNDCVLAASGANDVFELNMSLEVAKKFKGRQYSQAVAIDANENYLVVGYLSTENFTDRPPEEVGYVDIHSRKELAKNGAYQKIMVRL